jgi:hypothetical protein
VIGDTVTSVAVVARLADFKFHYDPSQLSAAGFSNPQLGVIVDAGTEELLAINPVTGISNDYLNLAAGSHSLQLKLYDGSLQKGKSIASQETVTIVPGYAITMDLVALQGETAIAITEDGGDATFNFTIPAEVVNEAGGASDLTTLFSIVGPQNLLHEEQLTLIQDASGDYTGTTTLVDYQYDDVTLSLTFTETSSSELLGSCNQTVTINTTAKTVNCNLTLRRRAVIGGNLLGTVGINVAQTGVPVEGASVFANGTLLGLTGSGAFGSAGYLKSYLINDSYLLRAEGTDYYGEASADIAPLSLTNVDIVLDTLIE